MRKKSTLLKKLTSYSGLATAAILASKSSEAQILYTDVNPDDTVYVVGNYSLDLNNDGTSDFEFNLTHLQGTNPGNVLRVVGNSSNSITRDLINFPGMFDGYAYADIVLYGNPIGGTNAFFSQEILVSHYTSGNDFGNWLNVQDQYMGLKIIANSNTYYGWARLSVPGAANYMVVNDYAIDTVADEVIKAGDRCGTYSLTVTTEITVPDPPGFCEGQSTSLETDSLAGESYQWLLDGNIIDGATNSSVDVDSAGNYSVVVKNTMGCPDTSNVVNIQQFPLPTQPAITQTGNTMSTDEAISYQWYHDGNIIAGATNQEYEATNSGIYTVVISDLNGCTNVSEPFTFFPVGISNAEPSSISVFESNNILFIQLYDKRFSGGSMKIFNTISQKVYEGVLNNENLQLDLNHFEPGAYFLMIEKQSQRFTKKIVVQ